MKQNVKLDFEIHWELNANKLLDDPMGRGLKSLGKQLPYRVYIEPLGEMISDRSFELYDIFWIKESHYLELEHGHYSLRVEDVTGWMNLHVKNIQLNTVNIDTASFTL